MERAPRDTPGCYGRGTEGVSANCLRVPRAPGRLSCWGVGGVGNPEDGEIGEVSNYKCL